MTNSPRRLALYLPDLGGGGAERVMVNLANGFSRRDCAVDLVLATAGGVNRQFVDAQVNVVELRASGCMASVPSLGTYLRRSRPQALIATQRHANVAAIVASKLARTGCKVIIREANVLHRTSGPWNRVKKALLPAAMRLSYSHADWVVANSEGVAHQLVRCAGVAEQRVRVIENPVLTQDFDLLAAERVTDAWLGDAAVPLVLGVGRLTEQKGFSTLIRAFSIVRQARSARLLILGEGEERKALERLVAELDLGACTRLAGYVSNPYPYMRRCSCFVLSSLFEGCPNALIQALLLGARVVSTDCAWGPREILDGGKLGTLVPVGNHEELAAAILGALSRPADTAPGPPPLRLCQKYGIAAVVSKYMELIGSSGELPTSA